MKNKQIHLAALSAGALVLCVSPSHSEQNKKTVDLDRIEVHSPLDGIDSTQVVGNEEISLKSGGDLSKVLRSTPGVFTRAATDNPGFSVNIRGLQGSGRVNSMIDGIPQTFRNLSGHGGTPDPLVFMDPFMVGEVDINKGATAGADGLGTLNGSVNFKTIDVDDVLLEGRNAGAMIKTEAGTNGYGVGVLGAGAMRYRFGDDSYVEALGAYTARITDAFDDGSGQRVPKEKLFSREFNDTERKPENGLFKLSYALNKVNKFSAQAMKYKNTFNVFTDDYTWNLDNKGGKFSYELTPDSDYISAQFTGYVNKSELRFPEKTKQGGGTYNGREGDILSAGGSVSNTSYFELDNGLEIDLQLGGAYHFDDYKGNEKRGSNPEGKLQKWGGFGDSLFSYGDWKFKAGLRYDAYTIDGVETYNKDFSVASRIKRSENNFNPNLKLSYQALDWLSLYGSFAKTSRAPTTSEMFYSFHDFTGYGNPKTYNMDLKAEKSTQFEVGFKVDAQDLVLENDRLIFAANYFNNRIKDFIGQGINYDVERASNEMQAAMASGDMATYMRIYEAMMSEPMKYMNATNTVAMQGIELSAGYDARDFYVNGAFTWSDTDQPMGAFAGMGNDSGRLSPYIASLDVGTRWFDEALTIGGKLRYVGEYQQAFPGGLAAMSDPTKTAYKYVTTKSYTLLDVYSSYEPTENFKFTVGVDNILDAFYIPASAGMNIGGADGVNNPRYGGRGRTIKASATVRF
ncbi:TonB-dependent receptor domain-containing protein [Polycladidibacter stylochi]|uniref:TonB-dependent receptor domain-containing protein n=1 Tax=Polycladidibacter stylochi TaxID=1807766 RepID=UPI000836600E|nr:TonB-dependent receptor [Pseudovibrio stylochi]